ncbi:hypothetical protein BaRGS_00030055 [Batillaria attramentaria]|uniref:15-hydroxyprostaglandin dehydrogenase [NAD(+)] n=1 Tax=Batillaria attramentaria TaxID=370345 RepID=A0ABD0JU89_9CAEN
MDLEGKGVFLTGGGRGVGRAMVEALLDKGARVLFCEVNEDTGRDTVTELHTKYGDKAFQAAVSAFGAVDICVNNAAIANESMWDTMIAVNQTAQIRGSLLAYDHMRRDKGGRGGVIINVASMSGFFYGSFWNPVYTATKHAMVAFTSCMGENPENSSRGVRWGCLCTMAVDTPLGAQGRPHLYELEKAQEEWEQNPVEKLKPSEVAEAFIAQLQDETNNGAVMKVGKEEGKPYHQLVVVDTSTRPYDRMVYKEKVFLEPHQ